MKFLFVSYIRNMIRTMCSFLCKLEKALIAHLTHWFKLKMSMHSDSNNCFLHNYVLSDVVLDKYTSDFFVTIVSLNNIHITKQNVQIGWKHKLQIEIKYFERYINIRSYVFKLRCWAHPFCCNIVKLTFMTFIISDR